MLLQDSSPRAIKVVGTPLIIYLQTHRFLWLTYQALRLLFPWLIHQFKTGKKSDSAFKTMWVTLNWLPDFDLSLSVSSQAREDPEGRCKFKFGKVIMHSSPHIHMQSIVASVTTVATSLSVTFPRVHSPCALTVFNTTKEPRKSSHVPCVGI